MNKSFLLSLIFLIITLTIIANIASAQIDIAEILVKLEQLTIKFDQLKSVSQSIANYYSGIGDTTKATCWREVTMAFEASLMKIENIKTEINKIKESPTQEDIKRIKDMIADLRSDISKIIDKIFECFLPVESIEVIDSYCVEPGKPTILIKNAGTTTITSINIKQIAPAGDTAVDWHGVLEPGQTITYTDNCIGTGARICSYELTPPKGKSVMTTIFCTQPTASIEVIDSYCSEPNISVITIKNIGTVTIDTNDITLLQTNPQRSPVSPIWNKNLIEVNDIATVKDLCEGSGKRNCNYRLVSPTGEAINVVIYCTGFQPTEDIEVIDAYCREPGNATFTIRNIGLSEISTADISVVQTSPTNYTASPSWNKLTIKPGELATFIDVCEGIGTRTCSYRLTPPRGATIIASVYCTEPISRIEVIDSYCVEGAEDRVGIIIKNTGLVDIPPKSINITQTSPLNDTADPDKCCPIAIKPGGISNYTDICIGSGAGRTCSYRLTPPLGPTVSAAVYCT